MSVRKLKPITPGQRFRIVNEYSEVTEIYICRIKNNNFIILS